MALALDGSANVLGTSGTTATTGTLTCANAGNVICVAITVNPGGANAITSITGGGVTFTQRISDINGAAATSSDNRIEFWTGYAAGTFNAAVVVNFGGSVGFATVHAWGVSGAPSSSYFDANGSLPAHMTVSQPYVVLSTTAADTMLITGFRESSANPTATAGWTLIYGAGYTLTQYKIVSAAQSSLQVNDPSNSPNGGFGDAIVQAAAGGSLIKTFLGLANASTKTIDGLANASVKKFDGVANV